MGHRHALQGAIAVMVVAGLACASSGPPPAKTSSARPTGCPLGVAGAVIAVTDTDGGVDLTFTSATETARVRARVRDTAAKHGPGANEGRGHTTHGEGSQHGLRLWAAPPNTASVVDVGGGATLRLVAVDPAQKAKLRAHVLERVGEMREVPCDVRRDDDLDDKGDALQSSR